MAAAAAILLLAALATHTISTWQLQQLKSEWREHTTAELVTTLRNVGGDIISLEALSSDIGERVAQELEHGDGIDARRMFVVLDSLAEASSRDSVLPRAMRIGIQLFDSTGTRVSWSGWPQTVSRLDEVLMEADAELVYSRKVSLYRILSHIIPIRDADGQTKATVLVDLPIEVNFRVNNRFLRSASLADRVGSTTVVGVNFDFFPVTGNLANRLPRFRQAQLENIENRRRRIDARRDGGQEPVPADSALTYAEFPDAIEAIGEITGDESQGVGARVIVRSPQGNPVIGVSVVSRPYSHDRDQRAAVADFVVKTMLILALLVGMTLAMMLTRAVKHGRGALLRGGMFTAFAVGLRFALLAYPTVSPAGVHKIFDPTLFATPALGGIMRSAGDLLLTAIFFVVLLYGLVRIARPLREPADDNGANANRGAWFPITGVALAALLAGLMELSRRFIGTVVINANPRLIGESMQLSSVEVLVLHLCMFVMMTGFLLCAILAARALFQRVHGRQSSAPAAVVATLALIALAVVTHRWEMAAVGAPLALFAALVPRFVRREDLVSIVLASFFLVIFSSGASYIFLNRDYDALRRTFVLEKSREILHPADDWRVVVLEDILGELAARADVPQIIRDGDETDTRRLAFDLWADGPLSLLGYSCAVHVLDSQDNVISEFTVDMPYRVRISEGGERIDAPDGSDWIVLDQTRSTAQGIVRFYRGVLSVRDFGAVEEERVQRQVVGKVIIDLPFFFENLELAARTGPRTPELLRNIQEGGVAPRVEEPEALLLARLDHLRVAESSTERVTPGTIISGPVFARALEQKWPLLRAAERTYRIVASETESPGRYLLAGFVVPTPLHHALRWSTLFSLYLLFAFAIIVAIIALGAIPGVKTLLPTLTPGRKLGFQQKLLASFLAVSLVPAIILGVFAVNFIKGRFVEENRQEALDKVSGARKAMINLLHGEMQFYLNRADVLSLLSPKSPVTHHAGPDRIVLFFADTGSVLESGLPRAPIAGVLSEVSTDELFALRVDGVVYVGVVSAPIRVAGQRWGGQFYAYYARAVKASLLAEIAEQVGSDVNFYEEGTLVGSSREGLLAGGFISGILSSEAFVRVSMLGADHFLATERAGRYDYQVGYLPVTSWGDGEVFASVLRGEKGADASATSSPWTRSAVISVPLVFRPESYYLELQRATSIILGIFALLFTATIGLGLLLARGIFEPLRALLDGTQRISQGDFNVRLPERRGDEIGTVVTAFNEMAGQVAASQRVLEERRRYLETILENIGTGVISTDEDDRIRTINAAAERVSGISSAEALGKSAGELASTGSATEIFGLIARAASDVAPFVTGEVEISREARDATIKYMLTRLEVDGRYLGTVFVFEDLTELIQSKKLSAWVEMAQQIAHEIKNPLTPIRISAQFMRRAHEQGAHDFDRIFREGTDTIVQQVDVLKNIASEFSSYGRMQELRVGPHALDALVWAIVAPYENNSAAVRVRYENGAGDIEAMMDPEAVRKICANLVENALQAMPTGGELSVRCVDAGGSVQVIFRDSGPGLSAEASSRLFEPYFSTKTTGTGLGLAICRTLSREMGGDVAVANARDGRGVEAVLRLRRA